MCGRLNVTDDPWVRQLAMDLGVNLDQTPIQPNRFVRAASEVQVVIEKPGARFLTPATWWLLLDKTETGFKPSKYTSFNTRYDKLNVPRSAGYTPFRESRCIILAKGFGETEFVQQGKRNVPKHYYDFEAVDGALAFGGLYRDYYNKQTGEITTGCSIITLPPHPKLQDIHSKASPLMLPQDDTLNAWLDPHNRNIDAFQHLLNPAIRQSLNATPIDKPSTYQAVGNTITIHPD
jgi:putative SOS response-associated peptidase YedK